MVPSVHLLKIIAEQRQDLVAPASAEEVEETINPVKKAKYPQALTA